MNNKHFIKTVGLMLAITIITLTFSACGKQDVSLKEAIEIDFGAYNGYGEPSVSLNYDKVNALLEQEVIDDYVTSLNTRESLEGLALGDILDCEFAEEYSNLSNGDEVTVNIVVSEIFSLTGETLETIEEGLKISIKEKAVTYTVEGLEDAKVVDPLSFVEEYIVYEGANGDGEASIDFPDNFVQEVDGFSFVKEDWLSSDVDVFYNEKKIGAISYTFSEYSGFSKGDEFNIKVEPERILEINLEEIGYIFNTQKTFTVPDLGSYITSKEELNGDVKAAVVEALKNMPFGDESKVEEFYWGTLKESAEVSAEEAEHKLFVFASKMWTFGEKWYNYGTEQLVKRPNGEYYVKLVQEESIDAPDKPFTDDYEYEKIDF